MSDPEINTTNTVELEGVQTDVEVIQVERPSNEADRPPPRDKQPLTRPVLSRRQREAIERSMTGPAEATKAQFRGTPRDKNYEGRKRSSPTQQKDPEVMHTHTETHQPAAATSNVVDVPRKNETESIETMTPLKISLWAVGTVAAISIVGTGINLAARAIAKKFNLNTPIRVVQG